MRCCRAEARDKAAYLFRALTTAANSSGSRRRLSKRRASAWNMSRNAGEGGSPRPFSMECG